MRLFEQLNERDYSGSEGICQACDAVAELDDMGLCETCGGKFERDMLRLREWNYSAMAFGVPVELREELRQQIVQEFGEKLEMVSPPSSSKQPKTKR